MLLGTCDSRQGGNEKYTMKFHDISDGTIDRDQKNRLCLLIFYEIDNGWILCSTAVKMCGCAAVKKVCKVV